MHFQVDTGAQCNVVPLSLYKKATTNFNLEHVTKIQSAITAYGGTTLPVVGRTSLKAFHKHHTFWLDCKLVDSTNICPLLVRKACLDLNIVSYFDSDEVHKPATGAAQVYTLDLSHGLSKEQLVKKYPRAFGGGVGLMDGSYHIRIDNSIEPVQHAQRRVPVAIRDKLKETLDTLVEQEIIQPVTEPTLWINSMVIVSKKDNTLWICLDPKDLNRAIEREHYPLPTIDDVATCLHGVKVFSILDVCSRFWHIALAR